MKKLKSIFVSLFLTLLLYTPSLLSQVDSSRMNEVRISLFGKPPFPVNIARYVQENLDNSQDLTLAYLRKLNKESKIYVKTELSAGNRYIGEFDEFNDKFIAEGQVQYGIAFIGLERQVQFRHFGLFIAGGIRGGFANYQSDFTPVELTPVTNFRRSHRVIGLSGQGTGYTNIADNIYLFATVSVVMDYQEVRYSSELVGCCNDYSGPETNIIYLDAFGIAFKF